MLWLEVQQVFPGSHRLSPGRRFPLRAASGTLPYPGLDYHLDHTAIPVLPRYSPDSLGVFLDRMAFF